MFAKKSKMKFTILGVLCIVFMMSCAVDETDEYVVGSDFVENNVQIKVIDTFTVNSGTFKLDNITTSGTGRILLGCVDDLNVGKVVSQSYFQINNFNYFISNDAVYDSIGFVLNYDNYCYGDTLMPQTYNIYRINETFEPKDDEIEFYNTSFLNYDQESIGEATFVPSPHKDSDSVYIPMKQTLGEELFSKIIDDEINNSDDFLQYFKGLTIVPDTISSSHVLGFNAYTTSGLQNNSSMRLYYTVKSNDTEEVSSYIEFVVSSLDNQFNAIKSNTSSTSIHDLSDSEITVPSNTTDHLIFAQAGSGISSRISISSIKKLKEISEIVTPLESELRFKPLKGSYDNNNLLKDSLIVYVIDHKNRILNLLTNEAGGVSYALLNENDDEFDSNTYYSVDLGGFVEEIMTTEEDLNYSLMVQFVDYHKSVNRVVIEDLENESDRIKLTVKYLNY